MLTDSLCKSASCPPEKKHVRLADSGGMYLQVTATGGKQWRLKYRFEGKEKVLALGVYPDVTLKEARAKREAAKERLSQKQDPSLIRRLEKLTQYTSEGLTFKEAGLEWHKTRVKGWSAAHADRTLRQLERDLFPLLGNRPIKEITGKEILATLRKVEERGAVETADRGLMLCRQIWTFVALDGVPDATRGIKEKLAPYRGKNFAAIIDPVRFGELLRAIDQYKGGVIVRTALKLAPLLFQRPLNLRTMQWTHLDLDDGLWTIPSSDMKRSKAEKENGEPHYVPLPTQAVALLKELQPYTGQGMYVFHGERQHDRPISDNSVRSALYSLGYGKEQSWHGFRSSGRTMLAEQLEVNPLYLEAQLAHAVKDANGRAYNRTQYLKQRREVMQQWADYLGVLKADNVIQLKARQAS
ncbi:MAG: integrase arm-type DNA-binding domain-containing protein [Polynucleobacter sp.]|uniref:tyrosine-type recombinase/integrase n=1 Tax=Polynucleobacter sp. TaxID=2029855 RepID=UPI002723A876|nr:integrase arm-type DNA-binding domain-containing protein [Polynucleobacter sp.]MDO8714244.1 integrase arm-type DNA-binding domain-containing protein [Polynucleobacter sp.]